MRTITTIIAVICITIGAAAAQADGAAPDFTVADQYFAHYLKGDIAALTPLMGDEMHFQDTASDFRGKQQAFEGLTAAFQAIRMGAFTENRRFHSGPTAVYQGMLKFQYDGAALGAPGRWYAFDVPFTMTLRLDGDKVVEHHDFVDTDTFGRQFNEQYRAAKP